MATVRSITADKAEEIYNASIVGAELSGGDLILRTRGGSVINVGTVAATALDNWPIGSIYISADNISPATKFGGGTWVAFATGRTLVGIDAAQTEFDTLLETGGEKVHTLTVTEMPSHNHGGGTDWANADHTHSGTTGAGTAHHHQFYDGNDNATGSSTTRVAPGTTGGSGTPDQHTEDEGAHTHAFTTGNMSANHSHVIASQGGGGAHNILQPYIVVSIWRRTA